MLVPVLHRVIVKPFDIEETDEVFKKARQSGIVIPEKEREREQRGAELGTVISIGDTAFRDYNAELHPAVGDKVAFAKYAGKTLRDDGVDYLILNDEDIVAIIKEGA